MIEDAFAMACKDRSVLRLVKFRSWRDGGVAAVQIQRAAWERDGGASMYRTRAQVDNRTGRRTKHGGRQTLEIRIGSDGRNPIWSEPVRYEQHREAVGRPTWIKVSMKYRGDLEVWSVVVTCADVPPRPASEEAQRGVVAVDVGFRRVGDDIRIAYARDDRGKVSELLMDARWRELCNRADRIRGHRDDNFNALQEADSENLFSLTKSANGARQKIERLVREGEEVSQEMRAWMHRDRHLSQYEDGCRRRSVNARKDAMRKWARELRRNYSQLVLSKTAVKKMKENAKDDGLPKPARRQGQNAAPGELLDWLVMVFGRAEVAIVKPIHTTDTCVSCEHVNDHGPETIVVCEECGAALDRDEASTRNMMDLWVNGECEKPTARKASAKFAKKHKTEDKDDNASPAA